MIELASSLAQRLIELATPALGVEERRWRYRQSVAALDELAVPVAVYSHGGDVLELADSTWRAQIGATPREITDAVRLVEATASPIEVRELRIATRATPAYYDVTIRPLRGCLGAPAAAVAVAVDVTDRVVARMLDAPPGALIWSGTSSPSADYASATWADVGGSARDWWRLVHPDDVARCIVVFHDAARDRKSAPIAARLRRANGEYRWLDIHFAHLGSDGRWFAVGVYSDAKRSLDGDTALIDELRAGRADVERANRIKDEFIAAVSHELRSPLATLLLWERILREQTDPVIRQQALDAIRQCALAQSKAVGELLDLSRAASGTLSIARRPLAIDEVVESAFAAAVPGARGRAVLLSLSGKTSAVVDGDATRIRQVLDNLLANAITFSKAGGEVTVRLTRREPAEVAIEIGDSGREQAPEALERMFEPLQQLESMLTRVHAGLDLGLAIARELVTLHGGTLVAASRPPPALGATFTITLPLSRANAIDHDAISSRAPVLRDYCVLLIDDDARVRDAIAYLLAGAGARVETADSAARGREQIARVLPDLLVCDIAMPGEDGCSFMQWMRTSGHLIPAIALTAHATESDGERATAAGFDMHLAKPVSFEQLLAGIADLIARARAGPR